MLRLVAWILLFTMLPIVLLVFFFTHFALLLWLSLLIVVVSLIYGAISSRQTTVTKAGPH